MGSENTPVDAYFSEKKAFGPLAGGFGRSFTGTLKSQMQGGVLGSNAARGLVQAGTAAAGAGAVAGGVMAAQKLYDAATKARDFRSMLEANPDLVSEHQENPKVFNQMFSTLRTFNPAFSRDPVVAGSYLRQMMADPMSAGGKAVDALNFKDKTRNPLGDQVVRAAMGGGKNKKE